MFIPQMFRGKSQSGGGFWQAMLGGVSSSQSKAGIMVTPETAMALSAVRACVTLLAESVAQLPCELYRRGANGGRERATDHPVYDLIHSQPNKKDTSFEYFEQQQGLLGLEGNCYSIIDRDGKGYRVNWTARAARAAGTSRCTSGCSSCCRYVCAGIDGTIQKSFESRCKFCRE